MQCSNLINDELWRAITKNTGELSALLDGQFGAQTSGPISISSTVDNLERQYQDYAAELRRRCSSVELDQALSSNGSGRPLLKDARALPDGQSYPRAMLDGARKQFLGQIIAGVQQTVDLHGVLRPLLQFVEVSIVRVERIVGFFVRPVSGHRGGFFQASTHRSVTEWRWPDFDRGQ